MISTLLFIICLSHQTVSSLETGTLNVFFYPQPIEWHMKHGRCSVNVDRLNPSLVVLLDSSDHICSRLKLAKLDRFVKALVTYMTYKQQVF